MPSKIQRSPRGIHGLFGTAGTGQLPSILPDTVTPTVDLTDFYGSLVWTQRLTTLIPVGLNANLQLDVGVGENWYLKYLVGTFTMPAGPLTALSTVFEVGITASNVITTAWEQFFAPFTVGNIKSMAWAPVTPIVIPAGGFVRVRVRELVGAAAVNTTLQANFYLL
jgi:hypothetical protein